MPVQRQSYEGQTFTPGAGNEAPRLALTESLDFELLASPSRYDVFETAEGKFEILPVLRKVEWQGGKNGIKPYKNPPAPGRTGNAMPYIATQVQAGYIHAPRDMGITAFGKTRTGYTHGFQCLNGDWHFVDVWRRPYVVGDSVHWERDTKGYHAFLRQLAELLGPIDENVKKTLKGKIEAIYQRRRKGDPDGFDTAVLKSKLLIFDKKRRRAAKPPAEVPNV